MGFGDKEAKSTTNTCKTEKNNKVFETNNHKYIKSITSSIHTSLASDKNQFKSVIKT